MADRSIAVLGLGGMGAGMAHALRGAGHPVRVHNRTLAKAAPLAAEGATVCASAAEAVRGADAVLLSLADEHAVDAVLARVELDPDQPVIDTSTVSPAYARTAASRLRRVEACVLGNPPMAAAGQLRVFTAGNRADVDAVAWVLDAIGQDVRYLGAAGRASSLKLAFNLLLGIQTAGLAEAVRFAEASGVDRGLFLDAVDNSGWRSPVLSFRAHYMREGVYRPAGFRSALMHKDLFLAQNETTVELPLVATAAGCYQHVLDAGRGDDDAAVIVEA